MLMEALPVTKLCGVLSVKESLARQTCLCSSASALPPTI